MKDSYRHKGMRKKLIEEIRNKGNLSKAVLEAMEQIPRHFFFDSAFEEQAYKDQAFPIGSGQTISQPYTVAFQSSLLQVQKHDKVLEIGTGSGYQAAILSYMGANVFTLERHKALHTKTRLLLDSIGFRHIKMFYKDGFKGLNEFAPFDKILITAGVVKLPLVLLDQIKIGGIIVAPVGQKDAKPMLRLHKTGPDSYETEAFDKFKFVPFLEGIVP